MKPVNFDYARPASVPDVLAYLQDATCVVKLMAGGQSLGPMLNMRLVQPDVVVDLTAISELRQVSERDHELVVGACVTHADIEDGRVPNVTGGALARVASGIAYRAVRNRGTIGGSLTHADPSADWISMLAAVGAQVSICGPSGERTIPVEDYMVGALEVDLAADELLVGVRIPKMSAGVRWGYYKSCRKAGEFAHAIGAVVVDPDREICRAVIGATESKPCVIADAIHIVGRLDGGPEFNRDAVDEALRQNGMTDGLNRQMHIVALRRAVEQAKQA